MPPVPRHSGRARSAASGAIVANCALLTPGCLRWSCRASSAASSDAILLQLTPNDTFKHLVPFLILFATALFMSQDAIQRRFDLTAAHHARSPWLSWTMLFQLGVAIYGGYFGAGIGILMLAALSLMGHTDIHRMNAVKNLLAACINSLAGIYFLLFSDLVVPRDALIMTVGAIVGGVGGAGLARRLGRQTVRRLVIVIGFVAALDQMRRLWL